MNLFLVGISEAGPDPAAAEAALRGLLDRLPFFDPERVQAWRSADGLAAAACVSHTPEQTGGVGYARFEADRMAVWSGRPFTWDGEHADGRAALEPAFYLDRPASDWAAQLDGRSTAVRYAHGELEAYNDALGAYPLFETDVSGTRWISNNAELLRSLRGGHELDPAVLASVLGGGWSLSGDPIWAGVRRIPRGEVRTYRAAGVTRASELLPLEGIASLPGAGLDADRAARRLVAAVRALADWPDRPSVVPVTGGRDSRLVFAAALASGLEFDVRTGGETGDPDVEVARRLAEVAGREHGLLEHDPHGSLESDWRRAAELVALASSGTASLADAAGYPLGPREGPLPLWHSGQGGEIARAYYGTAGRLDRNGVADHLYRRFVGRRPGRAELLSGEGARLVRRQVRGFVDEQLDAGVDPVDVPDMFYLLKRMGTWAGPGHGSVELVRDTTSPLWSTRLLPDLLGLPAPDRAREQFHRRVLERLAPELVDVPFERGEGWPEAHSAAGDRVRGALTLARKAAEEAQRRARAIAARASRDEAAQDDDSFGPVVADVRELVLSSDDHPAWPLLDRDRVERLLAREPASLDAMSRYYVWRLATVFAAPLAELKSCANATGSGTLSAMAEKVEAGNLSVVEDASLSDVGRERDHNEDAYYSDDPVYAVADGMGGAQAGEVAAGMAIEALQSAHRAGDLPERLVPMIEEANAKIHSEAREDSSRAGMGCTLTTAVVEESDVVIGHVGDSRAYRMREGHLEQITEDHSLVAGLIKLGKLTPEEAKTHPQRSVILRALGPAAAVEVDLLHVDSREDDVFLLCSDGLTGMVKDEVIEETLTSLSALDEALECLIACANAAGGVDNITAVAFRLGRAV